MEETISTSLILALSFTLFLVTLSFFSEFSVQSRKKSLQNLLERMATDFDGVIYSVVGGGAEYQTFYLPKNLEIHSLTSKGSSTLIYCVNDVYVERVYPFTVSGFIHINESNYYFIRFRSNSSAVTIELVN